MRYKAAAASFMCIFLFVSCAHHAGEENALGSTLKNTATLLDSSTEWTDSLEGDVLNQNSRKDLGISSGISGSVDMLPVSEALCHEERIYPKITGAYSLDVSGLPEECLETLNGFLCAFEKNEGLESYFETSGIYTLVMFKYDFQRLYGDLEATWHVIGEPFCGDGYFQCPVRIFFDESRDYNGLHADAMIFVRNGESGCRIISVDLVNQPGD